MFKPKAFKVLLFVVQVLIQTNSMESIYKGLYSSRQFSSPGKWLFMISGVFGLFTTAKFLVPYLWKSEKNLEYPNRKQITNTSAIPEHNSTDVEHLIKSQTKKNFSLAGSLMTTVEDVFRYQTTGDKPRNTYNSEKFDNNVQHFTNFCRKGDLKSIKSLIKKIDITYNWNEPLRESCKFGHLEVVCMLLENKRVNPSDYECQSIRVAARGGYHKIVQALLEKGVNPSTCNNEAFRVAVMFGHLDVVKMLIKDSRVDPSVESNFALRIACSKGYSEIVSELLGHPKVNVRDKQVIRNAASSGNVGIVRELLKYNADPSVCNSESLRVAAMGGHLGVVQELLVDERVDPSANENEALRYAVHNGHVAIAMELLKDKRVDVSVNSFEIIKTAQREGFSQIIQYCMKDQQVLEFIQHNSDS